MSDDVFPDRALRRVHLTVKEAAHLFGVHPSTIRHWASDGLIHAVGRTPLGAKLYPYTELVEAEHLRGCGPRSHRARGRRT